MGVMAFLRGRAHPADGPVRSRIHALDERVERVISPHRSPAADRLFYSLSSAADHGLLWLTIGAVRAAVVPRHRSALVRLGVAMGVESIVTNGVIKTPFRRLRPAAFYEEGPLPFGLHRPITSAFPSGHAASAFTAATLLAEDDPLAPAYYGLAALVAVSRVYVRMHHASDITAGAAWGAMFGRLVRRKFPLP